MLTNESGKGDVWACPGLKPGDSTLKDPVMVPSKGKESPVRIMTEKPDIPEDKRISALPAELQMSLPSRVKIKDNVYVSPFLAKVLELSTIGTGPESTVAQVSYATYLMMQISSGQQECRT